jgi:hypothetical protein
LQATLEDYGLANDRYAQDEATLGPQRQTYDLTVETPVSLYKVALLHFLASSFLHKDISPPKYPALKRQDQDIPAWLQAQFRMMLLLPAMGRR